VSKSRVGDLEALAIRETLGKQALQTRLNQSQLQVDQLTGALDEAGQLIMELESALATSNADVVKWAAKAGLAQGKLDQLTEALRRIYDYGTMGAPAYREKYGDDVRPIGALFNPHFKGVNTEEAAIAAVALGDVPYGLDEAEQADCLDCTPQAKTILGQGGGTK